MQKLLMHIFGWRYSGLEFIYVTAPHAVAPDPERYSTMAKIGKYEKTEYRSWNVWDQSMLQASISHVESLLQEHAPVHGIAGICDGSILAALVATRTPSLELYINFCAGPASRLLARGATTRVQIPSLHFIGSADEQFSAEELLEMPRTLCNQAAMRIIHHGLGHVVPPLKKDLALQFTDDLTAVLAARSLPLVFEPRRELAEPPEVTMRIDDVELASEASASAQQDQHDSEESLVKHPSTEGDVPKHLIKPEASKLSAVQVLLRGALLVLVATMCCITFATRSPTAAAPVLSSGPLKPQPESMGGHLRRSHLDHHNKTTTTRTKHRHG